jgi:hypothetical protein
MGLFLFGCNQTNGDMQHESISPSGGEFAKLVNEQMDAAAMRNMDFGQAIRHVKDGKLVAREGWNGKGMFIFLRPADTIQTQGDGFTIQQVKSLPQAVKEYYQSRPDTMAVMFTPYLCMKAADNTIVNGWLASQTDMLAEDWHIVE